METKKFKSCYFVIYDSEDNIVAYLESFQEISKYTKLNICDIAKRYNNGYRFVFDNKFYTLVAFNV